MTEIAEKKGEGCVSHTAALYTASPSSGENKQAARLYYNKPALAKAGHLQLKPGTDVVVANGILCVLVNENQ